MPYNSSMSASENNILTCDSATSSISNTSSVSQSGIPYTIQRITILRERLIDVFPLH